jgi:hypothetical protein
MGRLPGAPDDGARAQCAAGGSAFGTADPCLAASRCRVAWIGVVRPSPPLSAAAFALVGVLGLVPSVGRDGEGG